MIVFYNLKKWAKSSDGFPARAQRWGYYGTDGQIGDIILKDDVWLGTGVMVSAGVHIGAGTIVATGNVVSADLPANVLAAGAPARVIRSLSSSEDRAEAIRAA